MNELKKEVENYDNLIIKKEQALKELKQFVESINKIQKEMKIA